MFSAHLEQRGEAVLDQDLTRLHGHGTDRDDAIGARVESGRLRVEDDEADLIDGRVVGPRGLEAAADTGR